MGFQQDSEVSDFIKFVRLASIRLQEGEIKFNNQNVDVTPALLNDGRFTSSDKATLAVNGLATGKTFQVLNFQVYIDRFLEANFSKLNAAQKRDVSAALRDFGRDLAVFAEKYQTETDAWAKAVASSNSVLASYFRDNSTPERKENLDYAVKNFGTFIGAMQTSVSRGDFSGMANFFNMLNTQQPFAGAENMYFVVLFRDSLKRLVTDSVVAP
jgi:hypothetical protein